MSISNTLIHGSSLSVSASNPNKEIRMPDGSISTPLYEAIDRKDKNLVASLLKQGANPNTPAHIVTIKSLRTPLFAAVSTKDPELVELLLRAGANPNEGERSSFDGDTTKTPLCQAIVLDNSTIVKLLLQA